MLGWRAPMSDKSEFCLTTHLMLFYRSYPDTLHIMTTLANEIQVELYYIAFLSY